MSDKKATLKTDGISEVVELPIYQSTIGPDVVDVGNLTAQDMFTYDPGFVSTAACESKITYIDGNRGTLLHRGYSIEQLAKHSDHLETCYLLLFGELPSPSQKSDFENTIKQHTAIDDQLTFIFKGFDKDAHPMAMLCSLVAAMSAKYHKGLDIADGKQRELVAYRLIAKISTLAAMCYKHSQGEDFVPADSSLSYSENFLNMMFGKAGEAPKVSPVLAKAIDRTFLLHADHEQNASTSAVRLTGSAGGNPYTCISAGIAALWGPSHGGANEAVLEMLEEIGDPSRIEEFVARAKDKDDPFRLMGFGHRVYKNFDPRANVMKQAADEVLTELGLKNDPLLKIAKRLEKIALEDQYFIEKKLYPNVDFYSGIILKALGIPTSMFTVIFALGRTPGWISHWNEMIGESYKIGRPRQLYTGYTQRDYISADQR